MSIDGLNPDDPGIRLLGRHAGSTDPEHMLLVCTGEVPGIGPGATRLIVDVREADGSAHHCVPMAPDVGAVLPDRRFETAVIWPRAHLGKDFTLTCIALAGLRLRDGGRVLLAARKQKGGKSLKAALVDLFGAVAVLEKDRGYHLFEARRTEAFDEDAARELLSTRYAFTDPVLGALELETVPGVFSRRALDAGTRALIAIADASLPDEEPPGGARVLDLCAGVGPLGLWAAQRWPSARVRMIESNALAAAMAEANAKAAGYGARVEVLARAGFPQEGPEGPWIEGAHVALINPPTHAPREALLALLGPLPKWLAPNGRALLVVSRPGVVVSVLESTGATVEGWDVDGYAVLEARWA